MANIERVLGSLLDPAAFYVQYVPTRYDFAEGLKNTYQNLQKNHVAGQFDTLRGAVGLVCFTLELLAQAGRIGPLQSQVSSDWTKNLLRDPAVCRWFSEIYKPSIRRHQNGNQNNPTLQRQKKENQELSHKFWRELDISSLELYRVGTTSFILRCQVKILAGEQLVLKCLLFPYIRVTPIADATRDYALKYRAGAVPATARVRSSTEKWILMDFVEGPTLQEFLEDMKKSESKERLFCFFLPSVGVQIFHHCCFFCSLSGFRQQRRSPLQPQSPKIPGHGSF